MVAEVYRAARVLFPSSLQTEHANSSVTVRIDQLKGVTDAAAVKAEHSDGRFWVFKSTRTGHRKPRRYAAVAGLCPAPRWGSAPDPAGALPPTQLGLTPQAPHPITIIHTCMV